MSIQPGIPLTCPRCGKSFPSSILGMRSGLGTLFQSNNNEICPFCRFSVPVPATIAQATPVGEHHIPIGYVPKLLEENQSDILDKIVFRLVCEKSESVSFKIVCENDESYLVCRDSRDWKVSFHKSGQTHFGFLSKEKSKEYGYHIGSRHFAKGTRFKSLLGDCTRIVVIDYIAGGVKIGNVKKVKVKENYCLKEYVSDNDNCRFEIFFSAYNPLRIEILKKLLEPIMLGLVKVSDDEYFIICAKNIDSNYITDRRFSFIDNKLKITFVNTRDNIFYMRVRHIID